jgi:hypothetical protein
MRKEPNILMKKDDDEMFVDVVRGVGFYFEWGFGEGIVAPGRSFFEKAFGKDLTEFQEILHMPETYIVYRYFFEGLGMTDEWRKVYYSLTEKEKKFAFELIESNDFSDYQSKTKNKKILELLKHYTIKREDVKDVKEKDLNYKKTKHYFDRLIKEDQFKDLTLTYDFEAEVAKIKRTASV